MKRLREEHAKRWEIIQNLEKDLQKKESKLQSKSQVVKDLKQTMEMERDKFEAALRGNDIGLYNIRACAYDCQSEK